MKKTETILFDPVLSLRAWQKVLDTLIEEYGDKALFLPKRALMNGTKMVITVEEDD